MTVQSMMTPGPILQISKLQLRTRNEGQTIDLVNDLDLQLRAGETLALVGESGCGKSLTSLTILGLLPAGVEIAAGRIDFEGRNLMREPADVLRRLRGNRIGMVFQEPMSALNPVLSIGVQIAEPLRVHRGLSAAAARERSIELLERVGIAEPRRRVDSFPHELSGGMRQRVVIAMAIACEPALLIADEPTTALDVTVQAQVVALLRELQLRHEMAMLFITHDLALVAQVADRVCVMYAGRIVEEAPTASLLSSPRHPYTRALLRCIPDVERPAPRDVKGRRAPLPVIPGEVARPGNRPSGCAFHPRCAEIIHLDQCQTEIPQLATAAPSIQCACWNESSKTPA